MPRGRDGAASAAGQGARARRIGDQCDKPERHRRAAEVAHPFGLRLGLASAAQSRLRVPDSGKPSAPLLASVQPEVQRGSRGILLETLNPLAIRRVLRANMGQPSSGELHGVKLPSQDMRRTRRLASSQFRDESGAPAGPLPEMLTGHIGAVAGHHRFLRKARRFGADGSSRSRSSRPPPSPGGAFVAAFALRPMRAALPAWRSTRLRVRRRASLPCAQAVRRLPGRVHSSRAQPPPPSADALWLRPSQMG